MNRGKALSQKPVKHQKRVFFGGNVKVDIQESVLRDLYEKRKFTTYQIADKLGCCQGTVWKRLKKFRIRARTPHELYANVPTKERLNWLYVGKKLSTWQIEAQFGFCRGTVFRKLKEYGIKTRTLAASHFTYPRKNFSGSQIEKAYLVGFRIGDLRVRKMYKHSETVYVECGSTKDEQIVLINGLFKNYTRVWITKKNKRGARNIGAHLNLSFLKMKKFSSLFWRVLPMLKDGLESPPAERFSQSEIMTFACLEKSSGLLQHLG